VAAHGSLRLPSVDVDTYNVELKDDEGFVGDRASKGAFHEIIENWRKELRKVGVDPLGEDASGSYPRKSSTQFSRGATPRRPELSRAPSRTLLRSLRSLSVAS
jgi:hypothetical protein